MHSDEVAALVPRNDAWTIFSDMLNEEPHLGKIEKRCNSKWFALAKTEMKNISAHQKQT